MTNFDKTFDDAMAYCDYLDRYAKQSQKNLEEATARFEQFKKATAALQSGDRDAALAMLKKRNGS